MTMLVYFTCNQEISWHSLCARKSTPGPTEEDARYRAERDGWLLRAQDRGGDRCPGHSGAPDGRA